MLSIELRARGVESRSKGAACAFHGTLSSEPVDDYVKPAKEEKRLASRISGALERGRSIFSIIHLKPAPDQE
jgi:hypothetical protein